MDGDRMRVRRVPPAGLGPMLRAARLRRGLGVRKAARQACIGHPYLLRLERGERVPSRVVAESLADALQLDPAERDFLLGIAVTDAGRGARQRARLPLISGAPGTTSNLP